MKKPGRMIGTVVLGLAFCLSPSVAPAQEKAPPPQEGLPKRALARFGTTHLRHGSRILTLAFSPDGTKLAAGGGNDPIRIWATNTGQESLTLPEYWTQSLAFTKRGSVLVSAGAFKKIHLWEAAKAREVTGSPVEGHKSAIKTAVISPDNSMLASGDQEGGIFLWEFVAGAKLITPLKGHTDEITALAFAADSDLLASASGDRGVRLWNTSTSSQVRQLDAGCTPYAVTFLEGDAVLATAGDDHLIRLWDVKSGKLLDTLKGHEASVVSLIVAPGGKTLISGAHDGTTRLWNLADKKLLRTIPRHLGDSDALALSRDGQFLACAGLNNTIRIFNVATGAEVFPARGHQAPVTSAGLGGAGKYLVSICGAGMIHVWDVDKKQELGKWASPHKTDQVLAFSPTGATVASGGGPGEVILWSLPDGKKIQAIPNPTQDPVLSLAYDARGKLLAIGHRTGLVRVWNLDQNQVQHSLKYAGPAYTLAFAADGKTLAASGTSKVFLWDVASGKELRQFVSKDGPAVTQPQVACLAFAPGTNHLALGCYDAVIRLMDPETGKEVRAIEGHQSAVLTLAFSPDGRTLATGSFDKNVRLWEAFSGNPVATFAGHLGPVAAVCFDARGRVLYSAAADTTLLAWDVPGQGTAGNLEPLNLAVPELQSAWQQLASEDAPQAHPTLWRLVACPQQSVSFLGGQLYYVDPQHIDQMFRDLDSNKFEVRDKAGQELAKYGMWMKGRLEDAAKNPPTEEVRRRVELLLHKLNTPGALSLAQERLRAHRVMLILEQIGNPEALAVIAKLAQGAPEPHLQREALASLERLKR